MKIKNAATLDLLEILYKYKWSPFEVTKLYYGHPVDGYMLRAGQFYDHGTRGFDCHWNKLLGREFKFDGQVINGIDGKQEYLQFNMVSSDNRYIIYRNKK